MILFDKIFLTYLFVSSILLIIALVLDGWEYNWILAIPFLLALVFIILYFFAKICCLIWGYNLDLYPDI